MGDKNIRIQTGRQKKRERDGERESVCVCVYVHVCVSGGKGLLYGKGGSIKEI